MSTDVTLHNTPCILSFLVQYQIVRHSGYLSQRVPRARGGEGIWARGSGALNAKTVACHSGYLCDR